MNYGFDDLLNNSLDKIRESSESVVGIYRQLRIYIYIQCYGGA